ncbi:MAG: FAD:protein FMN transferase [Roseburia sp.]|nr:FAD:protein FMN transferase [Roseburia sp.]
MKKKILRLFGCGAAMAICLSGCGFSGRSLIKAAPEGVTREVFAMDTYMTITVYGDRAEEAAAAAVAEINRLELLLSTEIEDSEVGALNETGTGYLTEDTACLWENSYEIYEETQGAFDITVYPVMKAWGFTEGNFRVPEESELKRLLAKVDSSRIIWDAQDRQLILPKGVQIDFGGIAKGYTGERLVELLKEYGVENAMLNLGGNVQLLGNKPDNSCYNIAVRNPEEGGAYIGVLSVCDTAIVTSGGYERYFQEDGVIYHHIIDPSTGYPAENGLKSVTVVCRDGIRADGYSTALFVLGREKAISFWREHAEEFDGVFVTDESRIMITEGLQGRFSSDFPYEVLMRRED